MGKTRISIIVPVYNVESYIEDCFNSIVYQTMTEGVECIFVDDCGTDGSIDILNSLIDAYSGNIRMYIIHHEKNRGLSAARNTGTDAAEGEYVYYLDSDDTISSSCLESMWNIVTKYPSVDIVQSSTKSEENPFIFDLSVKSKHLPDYSENVNWIRETLLSHKVVPVTAWNKLIRHDFITDNGIIFPEGYIHEDEFWTYRAQKHIHSIAFCKKFTYYYRSNPKGITSTFKKGDAIAYKALLEEIKCNMSKSRCRIYEFYMMVHCANLCKNMPNVFQNSSLSKDGLFVKICNYAIFKSKYRVTSIKGLYYKIAYRILSHIEIVNIKR